MPVTPKHPHDMRCIQRMDYARNKGWWVRLFQGTEVMAQKSFSDSKCGGMAKGLRMAKVWRDEALKQLGRDLLPPKRYHYIKCTRNVTGVIGVALGISPGRMGMARFNWCAHWSGRIGGQRCKSFSVLKYGYRAAFQMAIDYRCKMVGLVAPRKLPPPLKKVIEGRAA